jgi:hypothetical protein
MFDVAQFGWRCGCATVLALVLIAPLRAADQPAATLDQVLGELADHIVKHLSKHNARSVSLGAFTGNPSQAATGGAGIVEILRRKLVDKKIDVAVGSPFGIRGRFMGRKQPENDLFAVHILATLVNQNDEELVTYPVVVYDLADMSKILGATASLPVKDDKPATPQIIPPASAAEKTPPQSASQGQTTPGSAVEPSPPNQPVASPQTTPATSPAPNASPELVARHDALAAVSLKPQVELTKGESGLLSVASPQPKSPYGVEIMVRDPDGVFQPRAVVPINGKPFVAIAPGETYQVRLINRSLYDAGVTLSIDGLSSFVFSDNEGYRRLDKWVVHAGGTATIPGWHRSDQGRTSGKTRFDEFTVTSYGDTPAVELGAGDQIGTITAAFCAAWTDEPPPDELIKGPKLRGTKRGKEIFAPISEVRRHFGQIRATVSIRYEKQEPPDLPEGEILMAQGPR